jgi:hypothetical protein
MFINHSLKPIGMSVKSNIWLFSLAFFLFTFASGEAAFASNSGVTYQGRILKPDGTALSGVHTQFKMQLRTPDAGDCLFYEETQERDLSSTSGAFSVTMNDGSGTRTDVTGLTLDKIFANHGSFTLDPAKCGSGPGTYAPAANDGRNLAIQFKDETMATWEPIPVQKINFVPFAFEAKQIAGFTSGSLVRVAEADGTLDLVSPLSNANYAELLALIGGTTTQYSKANQLSGVAMPSMNSGEVLGWNGAAWVSTSPVPGANSITNAMLQANSVSTSQVANNVSISTSGTLTSAITTTRDFKIFATSPSVFSIDMQAPALAASYSLVWPMTAGSPLQVLTTDGAGNLSWAAPASSSQWITNGSDIGFATGKVGIGTTAPTGPLTVVGGTSAAGSGTSISLAAQGAGAGAFNGGNVNLSGGNATTTGTGGSINLTVGTTAGTGAPGSVQINSFTDNITSGGHVVLSLSELPAPGSPSTANYNGVVSNMGYSSFTASSPVATVTGGTFYGGNYGSSATIGAATGIMGAARSTGTLTVVTTAVGVQGNVSTNVTDTTTSAYGGSFDVTNSGTTTNAFGVYTGNIQGTNKWSFYASDASAPSYFAGNVGVGVPAPSAKLNLPAGTAAAGTAPLKFTSGTNLGTAEDGAMEYASSNLYFTIGATRYVIPTNTAAGNYSNVTTISNSAGSITMTPLAGNSVVVNSATVSTTPTSGALIVSGGVGVSGDVNTTGAMTLGTSLTAPTSIYTPQLYGASTASANIKIDGANNATKGNVLLASAGGNVGIGTTAPTASLYVVGPTTSTAGVDGMRIFAGSTTGAATNGGAISLTTGSAVGGNGGNMILQAAYGASHGGNITLLTNDNNNGLAGGDILTQSAGNLTLQSELTTTIRTVQNGDGVPGDILIRPGNGTSYYNGGSLTLAGGTGGNGASNTAGTVNITAGTAAGTASNGGSVFINSGPKTAGGVDGSIVLGNIFGKVGIGTTSPASTLQVAGAISNTVTTFSTAFTCASTVLDFSTSNFQRLSPSNTITAGSCGVVLSNLVAGSNYTLVVTGNAAVNAVTYAFSGYTFKYLPTNVATTAGKDTIYTFLYDGTTVYVTWSGGY